MASPQLPDIQEIRSLFQRGTLYGLGESAGPLLDLVAFLCILRTEEAEDRERQAISEFNGDEALPAFPTAARWETLASIPPDQLASHIERVLFPLFARALENSPLRLLPRLFQPQMLTPVVVSTAIRLFSQPDLPFDRLLALERGAHALKGEGLLETMFLGWKGIGEFATPNRVADLMIDLAAPKAGDRIYNPCFGFGTLMVRTAKRVILPALRDESPVLANSVRTSTFFGLELNARLCLVTLARLMLAGITRPLIDLGDVLERPSLVPSRDAGFDCILCNPPFGLAPLPEQSARFPIQSRALETLIFQHVLACLRPGGRAVVLMPEAFLYRPGPEELLRKRIVNDYRLEAVVSLPEGSWGHTGGLRGSLLVVHKLEPLPSVAFIQAKTTQEILWKYASPDSQQKAAAQLLKQLGRPVPPQPPDTESSENQLLILVDRQPTDSLPARHWELVPRGRKGDQLQVMLDTIQRVSKDATISQLGLSASVRSGFSYARSDLAKPDSTPAPDDSEIVRLIRVSDLAARAPKSDLKLTLSRETYSLKAEAASRISSRYFVQAGDLLFSAGGPVGKVAIVPAGLPRAVAGSGLAIIRISDPALRSYLPRLLSTDPYQHWLSQRSYSSGYQTRLTIDEIKRIPIPLFRGGVPPQVLATLEPGQSLESMLNSLEQKSGFSTWVRFTLDDPAVRAFCDPAGSASLSQLQENLKALCASTAKIIEEATGEAGVDPLLEWLTCFHDYATRLLDIFELPLGQERFASLQSWKLALQGVMTEFRKAYMEVSKRAHSVRSAADDSAAMAKILTRVQGLYDTLLRTWKVDADAHLNSVTLNANLTPALVTVGVPTEISLALANDSPLPVRKLTLQTRPFESTSTCPLLKPGSAHHWPVKITGRQTGKQSLFVQWTARRLDESVVTGEIELAFEVASLRVGVASPDALGENPYIYRRLPDGKHEGMFYGREPEIRRILENLDRQSAATILLVEGNRGIGKTWLIKHITARRLPDTWVPVFIDFQDFEGESGPTARPGIPTRNIFIGMARELITAARKALPQLELPGLGPVPPITDLAFRTFLDAQAPKLIAPDQPWTTFKTLFHLIRAALAPKRLLLLLEEFDRIQDGIDSGITSDQVPENLRSLFQHQGEVAGIFTGSRTIRRLRKDYWNILFSLGDPVTLRGLEPAQARLLIEKPVSGRLVYAEEAIRNIIQITACQPLLIQGICHRVFALCKQRKHSSVTLELVDEVVNEKTADNEHFETLWGYIHSERRRCLLFIVDEFTGKDAVAVTFNVLRTAIDERGIQYSRQELEADLKYLIESDILRVDRLDRFDFYRLQIPMFALWLRRNKDFDQTLAAAKDEIV